MAATSRIFIAFKDPMPRCRDCAVRGRKLFQSIFLCTTFVNTAGGLASHASVSRLLYVMGRDNVFPEPFWLCASEWRTPALNVITGHRCAVGAVLTRDRHRVD